MALMQYDGEPYDWYIERVCSNPIASVVMLHVLKIKLESTPADGLKDYEVARYEVAREKLLESLEKDRTL